MRLEDGLKLDLNELVRDGFGPRDNEPVVFRTEWTSNRTGPKASAGMIIQKHDEDRASLRVLFPGRFEQRVELITQPRHFGGRQWYFVCPITGRKCSVLWQPPGAHRFCSRQAWGNQVAYQTQFETPFDRAITAREKVKDRLIGDLDRRAWDLPPKPKWMRLRTYERLAEKYLHQQRIIDQTIADYLR
ncbi:hypothetical protein [Methyloceanibacter sp. wino2]|uniref:hypothetical protein n=1 Tax=Methyloceanibacter sp. wino2 TaxID=2170729 RepID=UPI000D3E49A7|nr:hypothetical protein [Methyloceanibacter sp. wino2]